MPATFRPPAPDGGGGQGCHRSRVDPGTLSRGNHQRNPLGAGDTSKANGLDPGMIPNGYGKVPELPGLQPVPSADHSPGR